MRSKSKQVFGVSLLCTVLSIMVLGCAPRYRAPDLPTSEVAVIVAADDEVTIISVDDLSTHSCLSTAGRGEVLVTPGEHVLTVQHTRNGFIAEGAVSVEVDSGRRYILDSRSEGYGVVFWLEAESMEVAPVI